MAEPSRVYHHLFGPVPSRRLGRSLGVDLSPPKTCSFNCTYCQLGPTPQVTTERREWVPLAEVLEEIDHWITHDGRADAVTLAGSGEPTLHTGFGEVLGAIRERTSIPAILLTNGSLFHLPEVRRAACRASSVKVTLSAPDAATWQRLHRPSPGLDFSEFLKGLRAFRSEFEGRLSLEVMVVEGVNSDVETVRRVAREVARVRPDSIQINTPVRPPCDEGVRPLARDRLEALAELFTPRAEVIGDFSAAIVSHDDADLAETLANAVSRHPATAVQLARSFGVREEAALACLETLVREGRIEALTKDDITFFTSLRPPATMAQE